MLACVATVATALVFLGAGILSARVSATVGGALVAYAVAVLAVAWCAARQARWALGTLVFLALLHAAVGASMATSQPAYWGMVALAVVALLGAGRAHLDDLRRGH